MTRITNDNLSTLIQTLQAYAEDSEADDIAEAALAVFDSTGVFDCTELRFQQGRLTSEHLLVLFATVFRRTPIQVLNERDVLGMVLWRSDCDVFAKYTLAVVLLRENCSPRDHVLKLKEDKSDTFQVINKYTQIIDRCETITSLTTFTLCDLLPVALVRHKLRPFLFKPQTFQK
jgi:hypothetical protein